MQPYATWKPENGCPVRAWTEGVEVEASAWKQIENMARMPFVKGVAVMPDVHWGMGATVGSVIAMQGAIIPAAVGVDLGCVDGNTEYLSPEGWRKISDYNGGPIMQARPSGEAWWAQPLSYIRLPCTEFLHFKTKYGINQMLSEDHRVLCWRVTGRNRQRKETILLAKDLAEEHERLKLGANVEFKPTFQPKFQSSQKLSISNAALRVQVMIMADGHLEYSKTRDRAVAFANFKKQHKIDRAKELLIKSEIPFTEGTGANNTHWFRFAAPISSKTYAGWFSKCSIEQLEIIADECLFWDGNLQDSVFFSRDKESADFIQFAFSATGRRAVVRSDVKKTDGKIDYRTFAHSDAMVGLHASPKSSVLRVPSEDGLKYCFTTETGFWLMRRGGNIAITGNCGMVAVKTTLTASDLPDSLGHIRAEIERAVPHGRTNDGGRGDRGAWFDAPTEVEERWSYLVGRFRDICDRHPKIEKSNNLSHLGTLGTGNHFIEVCLDEFQNVWVMLHSGSRGVGGRIGSYFIEKAKEEMKRWYINLPDVNLAYFPEGSEHFWDYCNAVAWAQDYAAINRDLMLQATLKALEKHLPSFSTDEPAINCHHNYIAKEHHLGTDLLVTRKGAVRAREGDMGIIPGSMGAKSYIVRGKGNHLSFHSCSHGAGRRMSRTEAKKRFTLDDHAKATEGVECKKDASVIDETPGAYKDIDQVMTAQSNLVEVVATLKQVLCVKG